MIRMAIPLGDYYHVTDKDNLVSIRQTGLKKGTYLTLDWADLVYMDPDFWGRDLILLQATGVEKDNLAIDPEYDYWEGEWCWFTRQPISPEQVILVGNIFVERNGPNVKVNLR